MLKKQCTCPRRKCGALANAATIKELTSDVIEGFFTLEELKVKVMKRFAYRNVQFQEFAGGVKYKNWVEMIVAVPKQADKGSLLNFLENTNEEFHNKIKKC